MAEVSNDGNLASAHSAVFKKSESLEGKSIKIEGYDFNQGVNYPQLLKSFVSTGFQASNLGDAIQVINQMVCFVLKIPSFLFLRLPFILFHDYHKLLICEA